jgi:hypothetical protein
MLPHFGLALKSLLSSCVCCSVSPIKTFQTTDTITLPCGGRRDIQHSQLFNIAVYVVPSAPGRTLLFSAALHQTAPTQQQALGWRQRLLQLLRPAWVEHIQTHGVVDADLAMAAGLSANK